MLLLTLFALPSLALAAVVPLAFLVAAAFAGGVGQSTSNTLWETTLQRRVPHASLSRVSSYDFFGSLVFNPVGLAVAGPVAAAIGTSRTLAIAGCWFVVSSLVLAALPAVRAVRDA
jgi:hypothetical protein